jgi:hypothetical protein
MRLIVLIFYSKKIEHKLIRRNLFIDKTQIFFFMNVARIYLASKRNTNNQLFYFSTLFENKEQ